MGCSNCKEKNKKLDVVNDTIKTTQKGITIFIVIWSMFAIYGIISFIKLFL